MTDKPHQLRRPLQRRLTSQTRAAAFALSGGMCSFPNCEWSTNPPDPAILEVAHIQGLMPGSPRYNEAASINLDNVIVLCASHHEIVDRHPDRYTTSWLTAARDKHRHEVASRLERGFSPLGPEPAGIENPLSVALHRWSTESDVSSEEHWQQFFARFPVCLAAVLQGRAYELLSKCYVGGKSWNNTGGSVLDFLAIHSTNVACIEIKAPTAPLLGSQYRGNTYLPSRDLLGGWLQVLGSRQTLLQSAAQLNARAEPGARVTITDPQCFLIIGNLIEESFDETQTASFELYRRSLRDVTVVTFDEVFSGLEMLRNAIEGI
ncbi:protein of unknown function [Geodermatophilus siccatus]|uniref:Shedu protein SduA C-terminal domain-containing protein n=1 Tax=Geodermatophilus siccatus TaxID=1137991 RepID=A0A1H0BT29_9ACTN|nr:Shedu anti-phage system protein SduA domain-containing protein [Geodermatophilus siccatus]SDN48802.1 protein of unknown function [Geodermatophilus siccatus]